jgi:hypothetical protein
MRKRDEQLQETRSESLETGDGCCEWRLVVGQEDVNYNGEFDPGSG